MLMFIAFCFCFVQGQWVQESKLTANNETGQAGVGGSVAFNKGGDILAVGGGGEPPSGAVWIFIRNDTTWSQQAKLTGSGGIGWPNQGASVALSSAGTTLAFGGVGDSNFIGAVWVFVQNGGIWSQQGPKLVGHDVGPGSSWQGTSVALSSDGNTLASGANGDNNSIGATWVFIRSGDTWSQQGNKLIGSTGVGPYGFQGQSVALSSDGNTLAVGGPADSNDGATWIFVRNGDTWSQQAKIVGTGGSRGGAYQGASVALSGTGDALAVGGPIDDSLHGAVWTFTRKGSTWSQQGEKLSDSTLINYGTSVDLSSDGTILAVGTPGSVSLDKDRALVDKGGVLIYQFQNNNWTSIANLTGDETKNTGQGVSVSLSEPGDRVACGDAYGGGGYYGAVWIFRSTP